ncbi:MAG: thioredoxin family protein [Chthoniobacteraceae bacterium]|jgi:thioredoxin-related protein
MKTTHCRSIFRTLALLLCSAAVAGAQDAPWISDFGKALAQAKAGNANILMDFTGSDWCPWCQRMDQEVLNTREFKDYATKNNLVLMLVDFPQTKPLPQSVQAQNNDLQSKYAVQGFPTFILTDKDGNVLGQQVGYLQGGPAAFIAKLDSMKK